MNQQVFNFFRLHFFPSCKPLRIWHFTANSFLQVPQRPPSMLLISCRPVRKRGQRAIPANRDSHTARVLTTRRSVRHKTDKDRKDKETRSIVIVCICNCKCFTMSVSLEKSNSERSDGRRLKINSLHVCVPRLAVTHQPRDWSDWSIPALICAQQPHLARSQGHTLYVHRTSQNSQYWDTWQR